MGKKRTEEEETEQPQKINKKTEKTNNKAVKGTIQIKNNEDILQGMKGDIQFLIRHRNDKTIEKTQKAEQVYKKIEGLLFQITQTKIGGRAVQLVIKCASPELRNQIFTKLLKDKHFVELLQTKYGHYIGITMIRNMVQGQKQLFFDVLFKNLFHYVSQVDSSVVVDRFLVKVATAAQINQMKQVFSEHSEKIDNLAMKIIEKGLHANLLSLQILKVALPKLINVEQQKVIEYFQQVTNFEYLHHKDGLNVFCAVVNRSDKKIRKLIVKNLQTYMLDTQDHLNKNSYLYLACVKLLQTVDDTKFTSKMLLTPLLENWIDHMHTYKIITSIYNPKFIDFKYYETIELENNQSLKESDIRMKELQTYIFDQILQDIIKMENVIIDTNLSRFVSSFLKYVVQESKEEALEWFQTILKSLLDKQSNEIFDSKEEDQPYWILTHPEAQRLAKSIILLENTADKESIYYQAIIQFEKQIYQQLLKSLPIVLKSKAIYLLIVLIEQSSLKDQLIKDLRSQRKLLESMKNTQSGMEILLKSI